MKVGMNVVNGSTEDLATNVLELLNTVGEGVDLRGANEGPVRRVEEKDDVLAPATI